MSWRKSDKNATPRLMEMTDLGRFTKRLAGQLLGGHEAETGAGLHADPFAEVLLLDEPTVGVDPLSRRELWEIILELVRNQEG